MFLLQCAEDNSLCIVDNTAVMCDETSVQIDDEVKFFYNKKVCNGIVVEISDDEKLLMNKQKKLRNVRKAKISEKDLPSKRPSRKPKHFSSSEDDDQEKVDIPKKKKPCFAKKKPGKSQQSQVIEVIKSLENTETSAATTSKSDSQQNCIDDLSESDDSDSYTMDRKKLSKAKRSNLAALRALTKSSSPKPIEVSKPEKVIEVNSASYSPTKDELKKMLEEERAKNILIASQEIDNNININNNNEDDAQRAQNALEDIPENASDNDDSEDLENRRHRVDESQLYGKNCKEDKMMLLLKGIYCKVKCHDSALGASTKFSHLIRRLLEGVFTRETLLKCTPTGKPGASAAKQGKKPEALNDTAKNAIIDYAVVIAKAKGWPIPPKEKFNSIMSQKLGEIKREEANAQRQRTHQE